MTGGPIGPTAMCRSRARGTSFSCGSARGGDTRLVGVAVAVDHDDFAGWVALLGDPIRAKHAYWHLVMSGTSALPAVRCGLRDDNPEVRMYCAKALDHLVDEDAFPDLVAMLDDPDGCAGTRFMPSPATVARTTRADRPRRTFFPAPWRS